MDKRKIKRLIIACLPIFAFAAFNIVQTPHHEGTHRYIWHQYGIETKTEYYLTDALTYVNQTQFAQLDVRYQRDGRYLNTLFDVIEYSYFSFLFGLALILAAFNLSRLEKRN